MTKPTLTVETLIKEATNFCIEQSKLDFPELARITDGKAVGTFVEHRLKKYLSEKYDLQTGNSAKGTDLPSLNTDIKVTSQRQPQSSSPYRSSRQKIFGLGYNLLVLVYDKEDVGNTSKLNFINSTFVSEGRTADYTVTKRLIEMIKDGAK